MQTSHLVKFYYASYNYVKAVLSGYLTEEVLLEFDMLITLLLLGRAMNKGFICLFLKLHIDYISKCVLA